MQIWNKRKADRKRCLRSEELEKQLNRIVLVTISRNRKLQWKRLNAALPEVKCHLSSRTWHAHIPVWITGIYSGTEKWLCLSWGPRYPLNLHTQPWLSRKETHNDSCQTQPVTSWIPGPNPKECLRHIYCLFLYLLPFSSKIQRALTPNLLCQAKDVIIEKTKC